MIEIRSSPLRLLRLLLPLRSVGFEPYFPNDRNRMSGVLSQVAQDSGL